MKKQGLTPTKSQEDLFHKMKAFLNGPDREFLLYGKPGVGKTTILKIILEKYINDDLNNGTSVHSRNINVAGITMTHQAKNVLGEHIPHVFTFAKAFGMTEIVDKVTGDRRFVYDKYNDNPKVADMSIPVFVHDEVSTYTDEMLKLVKERTELFSKIIYVGDNAQLPPIGVKYDRDASIFYENIPDHCKHELKERVRQAEGNAILNLSDVIREEIFGAQNISRVVQEMKNPNITEDEIGYTGIKYADALNHFMDKDPLKNCFIAYRNNAVSHFNEKIRNRILNNPKNEIVENEIICMMNNFYHKDPNDQIGYAIFNSEKFKLTDVYTCVQKYFAGKKTYRIDCYVGKVNGGTRKFITPTESGRPVYEKALNEVADMARDRNNYSVTWDDFWKFKDFFCSYDYGFAVTAYKVQGSTYENVYVDVNDILTTGPLTPKRKLQSIYTAITRAKKAAFLLQSK